MARKVHNPFTDLEGYQCFGCSPRNEIGLQMSFYEDGDYLKSDWQPRERFQGYYNVLHGGILSTLMDEIASWYIFTQLKTAGVTARIEVKFLKPVYTNKGKITLQACLKDYRKRLADIEVKVFDKEGVLCTEGIVQYFVFPEEYARKNLYYPDFDSFFKEQD
jgi:uncharacterized protein (TIGR00369 family)